MSAGKAEAEIIFVKIRYTRSLFLFVSHCSLKLQSECIRKQAGRGSLRVLMNTGHSSLLMIPMACVGGGNVAASWLRGVAERLDV